MVVMLVIVRLVLIIGSGGDGHGDDSFKTAGVMVGLGDSCQLRASRWSRYWW